jgi:hypothetical protein
MWYNNSKTSLARNFERSENSKKRRRTANGRKGGLAMEYMTVGEAAVRATAAAILALYDAVAAYTA